MRVGADVAVVGGGPAGLAAALAARRAGASVVLLDEYPERGGQFYRQLSGAFRVPSRTRLGGDYTKGDALLRDIEAAGITAFSDALVWGSFEPGELNATHAGEPLTVTSRRTIVATGACERPAAFPGWDLPGVMTPGAAQTLVKHQQTLPGERIVLAGSGPFLLAVAATLVEAGANIVRLIEATRPAEWLARGLAALPHGARMREAWRYYRVLASARVPVSPGAVVVRAEGSETVQRVVWTRCDRNGHVIPGTERSESADTLCVGYGFIPAVQITRMLGCRHAYSALRGGWIPLHDDDLETSVAGVFVAGEAAGIGGAHAAMAEGELAGLVAARQLGFDVAGSAVARARARRARHRRFGDVVNRVFAYKPGIDALVTDDVVVCRCEEVTAGAVRSAVRHWAPDVNFVKGLTRCGMGLCQGRVCGSLVAAIAARTLGCPLEDTGSFGVRMPVKPIALGDLAELESGTR